jgi:predicted amidohydrolase YtcJ
MNLTASVQPIHAVDDMDVADLLFGNKADRVYRFRSLADSGALLALGSDAPVADPNPFLGFQAAIGRQRSERMAVGPWFGEERLTLEQTIHGYTMGAAQASGWEAVIGSISSGKRADLIVLDRDLFHLIENGERGSGIAQTQVDMTVFDGEVVFNR